MNIKEKYVQELSEIRNKIMFLNSFVENLDIFDRVKVTKEITALVDRKSLLEVIVNSQEICDNKGVFVVSKQVNSIRFSFIDYNENSYCGGTYDEFVLWDEKIVVDLLNKSEKVNDFIIDFVQESRCYSYDKGSDDFECMDKLFKERRFKGINYPETYLENKDNFELLKLDVEAAYEQIKA